MTLDYYFAGMNKLTQTTRLLYTFALMLKLVGYQQ